jgi:O-antigen ligase/tetratricopeptide (TPR) repeat protein
VQYARWGWFHRLIEAILFLVITLSPWFFGSVDPTPRALLLIAVASVAALAGASWLAGDKLPRQVSSFEWVLGAFVVLSTLQLLPLPRGILQRLSPHAVQVRQELLPEQREVFLGDSNPLAPDPSNWRTLSLYPTATREALIHLLALGILVFATRQFLASPESLRRFAWVCLITGASLAVFAIIQQQSSPPKRLYWRFDVPFQVFGPFVNKNHFPDYACLCLGASTVLFTSPRRSQANWSALYETAAPTPIFANPRLIWLAFLFALVIVACFFSLSRGGIIAMLAATLVSAFLVGFSRQSTGLRLGLAAAVTVIVILITLLLGSSAVEARIASIWQSDDWRNRVRIWSDVVPHLKRYALFGSGFGTFEFVEPMYSTHPRTGPAAISEHAHNEYLEAAFEGGIPGFMLVVALAILPTVHAYRRLRRASPNGEKRLAALGLSWGLNVLAFHSLVDFGIHLPAVACLAAICAGHLAALNAPPLGENSSVANSSPRRAAWLWSLAIWSTVPVLLTEAVTSALSNRYVQAAVQWEGEATANGQLQRLEYWEVAARLRQDDALVHQRAGQAYLNSYLQTTDAPCNEFLRRGLQHLVLSRDLCPFLAQPHARMGEWRHALAAGDSRVRYFERAVRVLPDEHELWFALGRAYLQAGRHLEAQQTWRAYLMRDRQHLSQILKLGKEVWGEDTLRKSVLPPLPAVWEQAATILYPDPAQREARRPYLEQAERLFDGRENLTAQEWYTRAKLQAQLGQIDRAVTSYQHAIQTSPDQSSYYYALVSLLRQHGRWREARDVLHLWRQRFPNDRQVDNLLRVVEREILLNDE